MQLWHSFRSGFNGSIWHALYILVLLLGGVFLWSIKRRKVPYYPFDPKHNTDERLKDAGEFGPHLQRYLDLAKLVIALSSGAIVFLVNTLSSDKTPLPHFVQKIAAVAPIVVGFFGFSIASLIFFMVLLSTWYEDYCHSPLHDNYKRWKYATCESLGYTGLASFILGFLWLAENIF